MNTFGWLVNLWSMIVLKQLFFRKVFAFDIQFRIDLQKNHKWRRNSASDGIAACELVFWIFGADATWVRCNIASDVRAIIKTSILFLYTSLRRVPRCLNLHTFRVLHTLDITPINKTEPTNTKIESNKTQNELWIQIKIINILVTVDSLADLWME